MHEALPLPSKFALTTFVVGVVLVVFGVYGASLSNGFVRFDDGLLIYENPIVRETSFRSLKAAFATYDPELYIPLTLLSYKLDYLLGGTHPFVYHLHNLVLHTLNVLLVAWLLYLLCPVASRTSAGLLAGFGALVFAIHPLHTEAVAWASARKDLLSTAFFLGALIAYLHYRGSYQLSAISYQLSRKYFLSLLFFLLGLLSKVMVITLPIVLMLIDWREGRLFGTSLRSQGSAVRRGAILLDKIPYLLLSLIFGVIALFGKRAVTAEATVFQTVLVALKSTVFYLQKLFVPTGLSVLYPYTEAIRFSSPDFFLPFLALLVLFVFLVFSLRFTRELLFGFLFFAITLVPTFVNFSKGGDIYFASDRYAYLPSLGILFAVVWALHSFVTSEARVRFFRQKGAMTFATSLGILLLFGVLTVRQSLVWANTETLFRNVLAHYPNSHRAHNNLANAFRRQGLLPEAMQEFQAALAIREHPKTLSNLGAVYRKQGKIEEALQLYEKAIAIAPDDPEPHFGLGIVYAQEGQFEKARASYARALALDPEYADVYNNMGALYAQQGDFEKASDAYLRALGIAPLHYQAHYNLGVASESLGRFEEAQMQYRETLTIEPTFTPARLNLGILLYRVGNIEEAGKEFLEVLKIDPRNAHAKTALEQIRGLNK